MSPAAAPAEPAEQDGAHSSGQVQQGLPGQLAFCGATNGSIAAWCIGNSTDESFQQQQQKRKNRVVWSAGGWHQSGVNAMHAATTPGMAAFAVSKFV